MFKNVIIGRYYQTDSIIHKLDARTKLFMTMMFLLTVFISESVGGYLLITAALLTLILLSGVPFTYYLKGIKSIIYLLILTVVFTILFTEGNNIFKWWIFSISYEGIKQSILIVIRLVYLVIGSSVLTFTTKTNDLTDGIEKSFGFLNKIKVPVHDIAMMMGIAIRFIPILAEEADKIIKAQMVRGADFNEGGLIKKAKGLIPLMIPLIVSAINRALELATAMETRCYRGGEGRTKMKPLKYKGADYLAYIICLIYIIAVVVIRLFGI